MAELILPGVYIEVRPEALIVGGAISAGNIGIVGTAAQGEALKVQLISSYDEAKQIFGTYDAYDPTKPGNEKTLVRALEIAYANGATTVYAVRVDPAGGSTYQDGLDRLTNEDVQIVVAAGQDLDFADKLISHVDNASNDEVKRERIAIVGGKLNAPLKDIEAHKVDADGRLIVVAPGIEFTDAAAKDPDGNPKKIILPATYTAAAIAGLLSSRDPEVSLTNKPVSVSGLEKKYNSGELKQLIKAGVLAIEERRGICVVKAITGTAGAFNQITTRRIVDYAKAGVRSAADPYIGLLNNDRVRKALKGSINGFLAGMVDDEMLISYDLDVTATRDEEIRGIAKVTLTVRPTFSIEFIKVVMFLG